MAGESSTSAPSLSLPVLSLSLPSPTDVPPLLPPAGMPPPPQRGHGGRRASSSLPAAEAASERLGGRGIDAGPTRSVRALHALGMARAEPCASFEYDIENAAAAFSSLSSLSIWHRERLREPTAGSLSTMKLSGIVI